MKMNHQNINNFTSFQMSNHGKKNNEKGLICLSLPLFSQIRSSKTSLVTLITETSLFWDLMNNDYNKKHKDSATTTHHAFDWPSSYIQLLHTKEKKKHQFQLPCLNLLHFKNLSCPPSSFTFFFSGYLVSLSHSWNAAISSISTKTVESFDSDCCGSVPEFHSGASSFTGRWRWRPSFTKLVGIVAIAKLLILDYRVGSPAWWRPPKEWGRCC